MIGLTRRLVVHPCLELLQTTLDSIMIQNIHRGSSVSNQSIRRLPLLKWYSLPSEAELQTTSVCVDFLRRETNLKDAELIKLVSSVETIGFNSVGQVCLYYAFFLLFCLNGSSDENLVCRCIEKALQKRWISVG